MRWRTEHTTGLVLLIALSLPVLIYLAAYHSASQFAASLGWANHSQEVLLQLDQIQLQVAAAEDEQNRYLIHPTAAHLDAYQADIAAARKSLAALGRMTGENREQQSLLARLTAAVNAKAEELAAEVRESRAGSGAVAFRHAESDDSLVRSQEVRARAAASAHEEQTLLNQRRAGARSFQRSWVRLFWGACILSLLLLLGVFFMLVRQIRERRRAQEALALSHRQLEESWQRYHNLIANMPAAVWTLRRDGSTEFVSSHIETLTGFSTAEVVAGGATFWTEILHPSDRKTVTAAFDRLFEQGQPLAAEFRLHHKSGAWIWAQARAQHVHLQAQEPMADGVLYDISEAKRRAEFELRQRELEIRDQEMQRSYKFKSDFLASVSHELRTPLSAILGFSDLLTQGIGGELNEEQAGFARHIHQSGQHLLALINDVLDLSRLESGAMPLHREPLELESVVLDALDTVHGMAADKQLSLRQEVEPGLIVSADAVRLRQILINLLSNAVKFTPERGQVALLANRQDNLARITVCDTGIGIATENLELIFERFQQVDVPGNRKQGSGLGLAITRQLVRQHGGDITVESKADQGSRFIFTLPLVAAPPREANQAVSGLQG
ncbi:MAG TPA: ATP-binding protein [Terriglobales bacterium]|nr:ATP-binding protein [Terriglobales bacterium]